MQVMAFNSPLWISQNVLHFLESCVHLWPQYGLGLVVLHQQKLCQPCLKERQSKTYKEYTTDNVTESNQQQHHFNIKKDNMLHQSHDLERVRFNDGKTTTTITTTVQGCIIPTRGLYLWGCLASSIIGTTLVLFFATLIRSLPDLCENSTAYTRPSWSWNKEHIPCG